MPFRFRRSIKLAPGVRLNLSKSGVSTSIGPRGAHVTVGHGQVRETIGMPGTGLSYTQVHSTHQAEQVSPSDPPGRIARTWNALFVLVVLAIVFAFAYFFGAIIR